MCDANPCACSLPTSGGDSNGRFRRSAKPNGQQPKASKAGADASTRQGMSRDLSTKSLQALAAAAQAAAGSSDHTEGVATSSSSRSRQAPASKKRSHEEAGEEADDSAGSEADPETGSGGNSRGAKRARLVWTAELHARFMRAMNHLVHPFLPCITRSCRLNRLACVTHGSSARFSLMSTLTTFLHALKRDTGSLLELGVNLKVLCAVRPGKQEPGTLEPV